LEGDLIVDKKFEQLFAVFLQKNNKLAVPEDHRVTMTIRQYRKMAKHFFEAGYDHSQKEKSFMEQIFGK
jgi:hypothetical protein